MPNKFKSAARNYTNSNKFLDDYEKLLKKNTGSSLLFAQDTGFNPAYNLTNQQVVAPEVQGGLSAPQMSTNYQPQATSSQRQYAPLPEAVAPTEQQGQAPADWTLPENPTANEMLEAIFKAAWEPQLPTTEDLQARYEQTGEAYPVMSMADGTVKYSDGSIQQPTPDTPPMPIASMENGTVLWSDGFTREMPADGLSGYLAGVSGLSQFIFGKDQTVTQQYGNYNPSLEPGSGYNYGTDFRTRDLQQRELYAPVQMKVVQVLNDDGTRWGDTSGHQGYGNSVLVQLPTGEMIRLSHLSTTGQFNVGDTLQPGDLIGTPGATGNTSGEHLDVEYYNTEGKLDNPNNFKQNASQYSIANNIVGTSPYQSQSIAPQSQAPLQSTEQPIQPQQPVQQPQQAPQQEMPAFTSPLFDSTANALDSASAGTGRLLDTVNKPIQQAAQQVGASTAGAINTLNPTGQFDLGITEKLQGNDPLANQKLAGTAEMVGKSTGIPEMGVSEAAQKGGLTGAVRQLAGNAVDTVSTPLKKLGVPDFGISEAIAGGRTVNTDKNLAPQSFAYGADGTPVASVEPNYAGVLSKNVSNVVNEAKNAGSNLISAAAKSVDDYANKVTAKAGEGIAQLKQGASDISKNVFDKPQVADIGAKRVIGEDGSQGVNQAPSSLLDMNKVGATNDNRDAFFKYGGAEVYKNLLNPGVDSNYRGALDLNLFKDSAFTSADTVGNIFGSSSLGKAATEKYKSNETAKYPLMSFNPEGYKDLLNWEVGYNKDEVNKYNDSVRSSTDQFNSENSAKVGQYNNAVTDYLKSIPSVISGVNWQIGTPKSGRNAFADAPLLYKTPKPQVDQSLMSLAPTPSRAGNVFTNTKSETNQSPTIDRTLMSNSPAISIPKPQLSSAPKISSSRPIFNPSLEDYLNNGKTADQWYAETGRQSEADAKGGVAKATQAYFDAKADAYRQGNPSTNSSESPQAVQSNAVSNAISAAAEGKKYISNTGNIIPNYTPAKANMTDRGTGLPVVAKNTPYPVMSMADGRVKYSDGSIRSN